MLEEDREPGQLRLEDLLKVPSNLTQAALYKYIADVAEQVNRRRKQKLVPRSSSSPGASSSEILDATSRIIIVDDGYEPSPNKGEGWRMIPFVYSPVAAGGAKRDFAQWVPSAEPLQ